MKNSDAVFLSPYPKEIRFKECSLTVPRNSAQKKKQYPFINPFLRKTLTAIFGAAPGPRSLAIFCRKGILSVPCNNEQAYRLNVSESGISIAANSEIGVLYALQTLIQLRIRGNCYRCADILDWPDQELRICARPLLCGEGNRSALAWGDGIDAEMRRWRHEIDFALRFRYNGIFVHGFTWDTRPYPRFAQRMRALNRYARERGVALIFGGYGIGRGGWGEKAYIGEAHNFLPGAGHSFRQDYPCSWNDIRNENSAYNGTCRSNQELRKAKVADVRNFIKEIEPGALYIHHEDQSEYVLESQPFFWEKRCTACREKWPNDELKAMDGGAGAIADGYDAFGEARAAVRKRGYDAAKDCRLLLASPCYGTWYNSPEEWAMTEELWVNVARSMKTRDEVYFVMREQFSNVDGESRLQRLQRLICEAGCSQRLMVFFVCGGALYGENAQFSSLPSLNSLVVGGNGAIFDFSGVLFQRPQQIFNSECSWNAYFRPNGETVDAKDREAQGKEYLRRMSERDFVIPAHRRADGYLARCCQLLYGAKAWRDIFEYQLLRTPHGDGPLVLLYQQTVMEKLFVKLASPPEPNANPASLSRKVISYEDATQRWEEQADITEKGLRLIARARRHVRGWLGQELERQAAQLEIGAVFARLVSKLYRRCAGNAMAQRPLLDMVRRLRHMMHGLPHAYPIREDGDGALYEQHLRQLADFIKNGKCNGI